MLILHLEDDPNYAGLVKAMLSSFPAMLVQATNTDTALEWLAMHQPDLIITDIALRGSINGLRLIAHLREQPILATVPVIIVSAIDAPAMRQEAEFLGVSGYLVKPVRWRDMLEAVALALDLTDTLPSAYMTLTE